MCIVLLVSRSTIVELVFIRKELSLLGAAPNRQNLEGSNFLLHPPSTVLAIWLRTARAAPTKRLRAVTFCKNVLGFNPHQRVTLFFNLDLVSRISEFGPVLSWSGLY